jgi:hypothetical protein
MNPADLVELTNDVLVPGLRQQQNAIDIVDLWYLGSNPELVIPRAATPELRGLIDLSRTRWLNLVVTNVAQALYVDGYRSPDATDNAEGPWRLWQRNNLDGRQSAVHRATTAYGTAYGVAMPGVDDFGEPLAVLRGVSPRKMLAFYQDPAEDDWPLYAIREDSKGLQGARYRVYDDEAVYYLGSDDKGTLRYIEHRIHDVGFCSIARFTNLMDLDGRTCGEVEPFIPIAKRIDKTVYDRLLTQHFNSWKVRTIAGLAAPDDEEEANRAKLKLRQEDLLVAEDPDTKFGTLPESPLDGFIKAAESDVKALASVSQTPVHAMVGDLINLSAEALAAARAALDAKVAERKGPLGKGWEQLLRAGSSIMGDTDAAQDHMAHVTWADTSIRSLAAAADGLGKIATQLGVPPQALWSMVPGVNRSDVDEWKRLASEGGGMEALLRELADGQAPAAA